MNNNEIQPAHRSVDEKMPESPTQEVTVDPAYNDAPPRKRKIGEGRWYRVFFEPGSAVQIICAAALAIVIGMIVNVTVDEVPTAAVALVGIPGRLWLRALQAVGMSPFLLSS
jgi:hypothetical protein